VAGVDDGADVLALRRGLDAFGVAAVDGLDRPQEPRACSSNSPGLESV